VPGGRTEDYSLAHTRRVSLVDFIDKELIQFSMADNVRSIPSIVDGLKFGQRKVCV
jgi:DNA gyrase/topoisomerase IV subunit A